MLPDLHEGLGQEETLVLQRAILTEAEVLVYSFESVKVVALNVESLYYAVP